jgi:hypothetical protein
MLLIGLLATATLGLGAAFLLRTERVVAYQERYAERAATVGPGDEPSYYERTRQARRDTFRLGGVVLSIVGLFLLGAAVYGLFVA